MAAELSRRDIRAIIFYNFKRGLTTQQCHEEMQAALGNSAPSIRTVQNWYRDLRAGRCSLNDDDREGRPATATTAENVELVRSLIEEDRRVTHAQLEQQLGIGSGQVQKILHEHLGVRRLCARWVPHLLTQEQKDERVRWCRQMLADFQDGAARGVFDVVTGDETWVFQHDPETKRQSSVWCFFGEEPPTKFRRSRSVGKAMVASFFGRSGHVATVVLDGQRTVTAEWYVTVCLPQVLQAWQERRPKRGIRGLRLHHDNASAHSALRTVAFLAENRVSVVGHPPYSPDLAPCDFFLFPKVKAGLRGQRFPTVEDAIRAYKDGVDALTEQDWAAAFAQWFERMRKCVCAQGNYFEQM